MLDNKLYILPTSRAIRGYINSLKNNTFLPKIITIGDFFSRVLYTSDKKIISNELKIIYLQEVIKTIDVKALGINSEFSAFFKQSEYILRFFNELASEFKTIDDLNSADTYAYYSEHLDILKLIQQNYHKKLLDDNYIDQSLLPYYYKINTKYLQEFETITLIHEGIFSGFEKKVLDEISQVVPLEIQYTNQSLIETSNIKIAPQKQKIFQVGFIKQQIYEMVTQHNIQPENIVVVLPDESFATLLKIFDDEKYFNFAMGLDISTSMIYQSIETINKILLNEEPKDKDKLKIYNIDKELFDDIKLFWNKPISKQHFIDIFDKLISVENNIFILDKLKELKISFLILFFTVKLDLLLKDIFKIISTKIKEITIDDTNGGKITVLGILETRAVSFDGVIVVDFNDDKVPKRSIKDKFLSTSVKQIAKLPTAKDREDLQRYYYHNLFSRAKSISISYIDDENSIKSRFLNELFNGIKEDTNTDYSHILYKENSYQPYNKEIIMDINLSSKIWSATSLKTFLECKRQYYFKYLAKLKEHNIGLKPQGFELGSIIHKILDTLAKQNKLTYENIVSYISQYPNKNPYLTMELEVWKKKLYNFIQNEQLRQKQGYKIYKTEKPFSFVCEDIQLYGTIDRIDIYNNHYEILDYKTSSSLKIDTKKTYEKSTDFQLEFYFLSQQDKQISLVGYYDLNTSTIKEELMLQEKITLLKQHLKALKTTTVNFEMCQEHTICTYCPYKILCGKE